MKLEIEFKELEVIIDGIVTRKLELFYDKLSERLPSTQNKFFRPKEVGEILGFDIQTVYKWIKGGKLKAETIGQNKTVSEVELNRFIKENPRHSLRQKRSAK